MQHSCPRLANVQVELDKLLTVRLRDAGDVRKLFEALKDIMYSMSMESLKHSAITPALLKDEADQDVAKELNKAWQSDACRLLRAFLEQPHTRAIAVEQDRLPLGFARAAPQEGLKGSAKVLPHVTRVIEVLGASQLPDRPAGMDTVDPYAPWKQRCAVKLKITCGEDLWWEAKSCTKEDCSDPEWTLGSGAVGVGGAVVPWGVLGTEDNGGALLDTSFAKTDVLNKEQLLTDQDAAPLRQQMQSKIEETVAELRKELKAFKGIKDTGPAATLSCTAESPHADTMGKAKEEADRLITRCWERQAWRTSGQGWALDGWS
eukprot:Skav210552  [mRNA]  locus=scaffold4856:74711:90856:- [translate_table: standard]